MGFNTTNKRQPILVLFCGLPGSGKTTTARYLERKLNAVRLCTDEWLADMGIDLFDEAARNKLQSRLYEHSKALLKHGHDVILEDGLWSRKERDEKRSDANKLGAVTEMHYFNLTFDEQWRRLKGRNMSADHGTVPITRQQLESYWPMFERPDETELSLFGSYIVHT